MSASRNKIAEAVEAWRATPEALRLRILSTTGGICEDEQRVIKAAPKPSLTDYERAEFAAADLLRAAAEPEAKPVCCSRSCDCDQCLTYGAPVYSEHLFRGGKCERCGEAAP
jgi:hypothetical protein